MSHSLKHTIIKTFILLMMAVVLLPCSTKREIKSAFDVPVSAKDNGFQKIKTSCSNFYQDRSSANKTALKQGKHSYPVSSFNNKYADRYQAANKTFGQFDQYIYSPVRLHQLYEQYII